MLSDFVGVVAMISSIIILPPQLYELYKKKSGDGVSMLMLINYGISALAWIFYGILIGSVSVWLTNVILAIFASILILLKWHYSRNKS